MAVKIHFTIVYCLQNDELARKLATFIQPIADKKKPYNHINMSKRSTITTSMQTKKGA